MEGFKLKEIPMLAGSILIVLFAGFLGSQATISQIPVWYASLAKPLWAPPNWVFGPVWTTLYLLMHLLKEEKVEIVGYDFNIYEGKKRIQSIRSEGVVFSLVKRDIVNMNILMKKFGSDIPEDSLEACYQIKRAMNRKLQTMESEKLVIIH